MKVWWRKEIRHGVLIEITYYVKIAEKWFTLVAYRKLRNKKRWNQKGLLITTMKIVGFSPFYYNSNIIKLLSSFEVDDDKIRFFKIPCPK